MNTLKTFSEKERAYHRYQARQNYLRHQTARTTEPSGTTLDDRLGAGADGGCEFFGDDSEVVGGVILKGKKRYWGQPHTHYHQGMRPGDNTLNLTKFRATNR